MRDRERERRRLRGYYTDNQENYHKLFPKKRQKTIKVTRYPKERRKDKNR